MRGETESRGGPGERRGFMTVGGWVCGDDGGFGWVGGGGWDGVGGCPINLSSPRYCYLVATDIFRSRRPSAPAHTRCS